ncbi:MAG: hypothetical protein AAF657_04025 [Acidobacteriota bacterium]
MSFFSRKSVADTPRKTSKKRRAVAAVILMSLMATAAYASFNYYVPIGTHDRGDCSRTAGWARDADSTVGIQVHVYKGAAFPYGQIVTHIVANKYRGDLPFFDKNHGFDIATPSAFKTGYWERQFIHAINVDTSGNINGSPNPLLTSTGKWLYCSP